MNLREIDALVAEKVMRWKRQAVDVNGNGELLDCWVGRVVPVEVKYWCPTLDLESAWELFDTIQGRDVCCIKLNYDVPAGVWSVEIKGRNYQCERLAFVEMDDGLPLTLSLAALKMVGVEVPR